MSEADWRKSRRMYARRSRGYEFFTRPVNPYRNRAVELLGLTGGEIVIDVACGTGANFAAIQSRIGGSGRLVGVDLSPDMLATARRRVEREGWENVSLVEAPIEQADLPGAGNAALFSLTHDVLQSRAAVQNVTAHLIEGGMVSAFGVKSATGVLAPLNPAVRAMSRRYIANLQGLDRPWQLLGEFADLRVEPAVLGTAYFAWGAVRPTRPRRPKGSATTPR
jgi:SAM-dependent methyltransferase